jgi:hypothetical protein
MNVAFLTAGQSQLLDHVTVWANIRIGEITEGPFGTGPGAAPFRSRESTQTLMVPSVRAERYLERVKGHEARLLSPLGIDLKNLEEEVSKKDGPSLNHYLWSQNPDWLKSGLMDIGRLVLDDLYQIHQARLNVHERVMRWKRTFGANESAGAKLNIVGIERHISWLRESYSLRQAFASDLMRNSHDGWKLVQSFYDSAARAAQNILAGAYALHHYFPEIKSYPG